MHIRHVNKDILFLIIILMLLIYHFEFSMQQIKLIAKDLEIYKMSSTKINQPQLTSENLAKNLKPIQTKVHLATPFTGLTLKPSSSMSLSFDEYETIVKSQSASSLSTITTTSAESDKEQSENNDDNDDDNDSFPRDDKGPVPKIEIERDTNDMIIHYHHNKHTAESEDSLRIVVLTFNRAKSLKRLLESVIAAIYEDDVIELHVFVDRQINATYSSTNVYNGIDMDVLNISNHYASIWPYGQSKVRIRGENNGLAKQWLESWQQSLPQGEILSPLTKSKVVILEDDLGLSPFFWLWLRAAHDAYKDRDDIAGFSLQRIDLCPISMTCPKLAGGPITASVNFLSPLVGSWGYSPTAKMWSQFVPWAQNQIKKKIRPLLNEPRVIQEWYTMREKKGQCPGPRCMWTIWHAMWAEDYVRPHRYTVYVRCPKNRTLASNYREVGLHILKKSNVDYEALDDPLLLPAILDFKQNPSILDWSGKEVIGEFKSQYEQIINAKTNPYEKLLLHREKKLSEKKSVLFIFVDSFSIKEFWDLYELSIIPLSIKDVIVVAVDENAYKLLTSLSTMVQKNKNDARLASLPKPTIIKHENMDAFSRIENGVLAESTLKQKSKLKLSTIRYALLLGYEVGVLECDVKLFDNPMKGEYIDKVIYIGAVDDGYLKLEQKQLRSSAFVYFKPIKKTLDHVERSIQIALEAGSWDFADCLFLSDTPSDMFTLFSKNMFLSGQAYFESNRYMFWQEALNQPKNIVLVHNNWLNNRDIKDFRWREFLWSNDDTNEYFSSNSRKYLTFASPPLSYDFLQQTAIIRTAFVIGRITNRTVVFPMLNCYRCEIIGPLSESGNCDGGYGEFKGKCTFNANYHIPSLISIFGRNSFRESSFFHHKLVPKAVKEEAGVIEGRKYPFFAIKTSSITTELNLSKNIRLMRPLSKNPTKNEIVQWFVKDREVANMRVLKFNSLLGVFSSKFAELRDIKLAQSLLNGIKKCTYRQTVESPSCPSQIVFK